MDFVTVFSTFNPAEAELIRSRLELAEFDVTVKNDESAQSWGGAMTSGGVFVQVPEDQATDAKALLDSPEDSPTEPRPQ